MIKDRLSRGASHPAAALVRLAAFVIAAASVFVIPAVLAAAARGHVAPATALATTGIAAALTLLTAVAARSLDPLRG